MPTTASTVGLDFCLNCKRPLAKDLAGRGFRRHARPPTCPEEECDWEEGERRLPPVPATPPLPPRKLEGYLTTEETASALGCTKQNVHKMIRDGRLGDVVFVGTGKPVYLVPVIEVEDRSLRAALDDIELRRSIYGADD